jgi:hypothetical protein
MSLIVSPDNEILLNPMQLMVEIAPQRIKMIQVGRGGGKSTAAASKIKNTVYEMPKSKNFIVTGTYQQALTRTLPSTIKALAMFGFIKNLHFFVGRLPPKSWKWPDCFEMPEDPKHSIFFYNGTVYDLLSQDTNSRGGNYCSGFGDEAQDLDQQKLESQIFPTLRLEYQRFKNNPRYRNLLFLCSMPRTRRAEWIFNYEQMAIDDPKSHLYISGPSAINLHNLPPEWFTDQKRILTPSEYAIEIENIRPKKVIGGYYPFFDDRHHSYVAFNNPYLDSLIDDKLGYSDEAFAKLDCRQDEEIYGNQPLDIAMDYGSWFNGIVTGQEDGNLYRFLSGLSINEEKRFEDLLIQWCDYYRPHPEKVVNYFYDHTAKDHDARADEYPDIVDRVLSSHGWTVIHHYIGQQPGHDVRYRFWGYAHKGDHPDLPQFLYHRQHCKYLIISLNNANVIQGRNGFEKDKRDEKNHDIDQRTTTHFSDAHDTLAYAKYGDRLGDQIAMPRARIGGR